MACEPVTSLSPDQSPDAKHDVVLVDDQLMVISFDSSTDELDALRVIVGAGVGSKMVTFFFSDAAPPFPVHVSK